MIKKIANALLRRLNNLLPWRPHLPKGAGLSWRARIRGVAKNIAIQPGTKISEDVMLHVLDARSRIEIGRGTYIAPFAKLVTGDGGLIRIGADCSIHSFDVLYGFSGGLIIEDGVRIGVNVSFISSNHRTDDPERGPNEQGSSSEGIRIGAGSWIGAGAIILDGVVLPPQSVVGAGAVVTKSPAQREILVGVPARPLPRAPRSTPSPE